MIKTIFEKKDTNSDTTNNTNSNTNFFSPENIYKDLEVKKTDIEFITNFLVSDQTGSSKQDNKDFLEFYQKILDILFLYKDYKSFDLILENTDIKKVGISRMMTLLRLSFSCKDKLQRWNHFYEKSYLFIQENGFDPKIVLCGLVK